MKAPGDDGYYDGLEPFEILVVAGLTLLYWITIAIVLSYVS